MTSWSIEEHLDYPYTIEGFQALRASILRGIVQSRTMRSTIDLLDKMICGDILRNVRNLTLNRLASRLTVLGKMNFRSNSIGSRSLEIDGAKRSGVCRFLVLVSHFVSFWIRLRTKYNLISPPSNFGDFRVTCPQRRCFQRLEGRVRSGDFETKQNPLIPLPSQLHD